MQLVYVAPKYTNGNTQRDPGGADPPSVVQLVSLRPYVSAIESEGSRLKMRELDDVVRLLSSAERAEQARGARDRQLFQFYKTFVAFGLLEARERETGARYSLVLRTRIDSSSGTNWISKSLQANWFKLALARGVEPGSVRLANDYSWLAVRRDAERLARIWPEQIAERCGDCTANLSLAEKGQMICPDFWPNGSNAALELIDLCSAEASAWSSSCSNLLAKTPIDADHRGLHWRCQQQQQEQLRELRQANAHGSAHRGLAARRHRLLVFGSF